MIFCDEKYSNYTKSSSQGCKDDAEKGCTGLRLRKKQSGKDAGNGLSGEANLRNVPTTDNERQWYTG